VEFGESGGTCEDDVVEDAVSKDDEGGLAGFSGFGLAPGAESGLNGPLFRRVGGRGLFALGFEGRF